ncbi:MAG: ANTAR domain-containing protein [Nocardioides sp.]
MDDDAADPRNLVERAKGALMLQFGIGSHQAFALLLRWARQHDRQVPDLARVLVLGVVDEDPATLVTDAALVQWLEERLIGDLVEAVNGMSHAAAAPSAAAGRGALPGGTARGRHSRS